MTTDEKVLLGEVKGKLDIVIAQQADALSKISKLDERLRGVERQSVVTGGVSGALVAGAVALIVERFKNLI